MLTISVKKEEVPKRREKVKKRKGRTEKVAQGT
jgi:hypothetical protein